MELLPRATGGRSGPRFWLMLNAALAAWSAVVLFLIWGLGGGGAYSARHHDPRSSASR